MKLFVRLIAALSVLLAAATAAIAQASGQGWLGVQVAQVTKADADALGWEDLHGVKVMKTVPGGPAEQAGLMPGDLILSIGGVEADDVQTFVASVSSKGANAKVKLRLIRNGKEKLVSVVLGARPLDQAQTQGAAPQAKMGAADLKWNAISLSSAPPTGVRGHIILIANSDYKFFTKLDGPGRDINAAASAFAQIGFRTTVLTDPSKERILEAIKSAGAEGEQQLIGLYYSGHAAVTGAGVARTRQRFHERAKSHRETKHRALEIDTYCCPVDVPVGGFYQTIRDNAVRAASLRAKAVESGQLAHRRDFENCATAIVTLVETCKKVSPAIHGCPVEIPVRGLHQTIRPFTVRAVGLRAKAIESGQLAHRRDFEDRPPAGVGPTAIRCPVEVAVSGLDQTRTRVFPVSAVELGAKSVKRCQLSRCGDFKDRTHRISCQTDPAAIRCAVEIPVRGLHQTRKRFPAVSAAWLRTKAVQRGQPARRGDFEHRSATTGAVRGVSVGPTGGCRPIEVPVGCLH